MCFQIYPRSFATDNDMYKQMYYYAGPWLAQGWEERTEYGINVRGVMTDNIESKVMVWVNTEGFEVCCLRTTRSHYIYFLLEATERVYWIVQWRSYKHLFEVQTDDNDIQNGRNTCLEWLVSSQLLYLYCNMEAKNIISPLLLTKQ